MTKKARAAVIVAVIAFVLVAAAGAFAKKPRAYEGKAGSTQGAVQGAVKHPVKPGGTLPFTGLDLGLFAAGGAALIVVGYQFTRLGRRRS
jgi:hypothetical protein